MEDDPLAANRGVETIELHFGGRHDDQNPSAASSCLPGLPVTVAFTMYLAVLFLSLALVVWLAHRTFVYLL